MYIKKEISVAESKGVLGLKKSINYDALDEKMMALAERGIISVSGEIMDGSSSMFFISTSFMQITRPGKPIWMMMNSPGGSATECFAIYDMINALVRKGMVVNILGVGLIASAATALMQTGVRRYSFPHTQFLIHQSRTKTDGEAYEEVSQGEERVEEHKRINRIYMSLLSNRTGMPIEDLIKLAKKTDYWLDAEAAKNLGPNGLIDEIVEDYPFEF